MKCCTLLLACMSSLLGLCSAETQCKFGVEKLWVSKLKDAPLTASPLLFDIDGDSYDDLLVPSFSGEVWGVHGENGHIVDNWPFYLEDRAFHASPLVYDVNSDGVLEFVVTTTDAEIVFVETDNTLVHGETIKIPPLKVKRAWHREDMAAVKESSRQMQDAVNEKVVVEQEGGVATGQKPHRAQRPNRPTGFTTPYSEFESRLGRHSDPLHSSHDPVSRLAGVDPNDPDSVLVDPHVLATPLITDVDGDGVHAEIVVPVSYYFDAHHYGNPANLDNLNGLLGSELLDYVGGGVVIIDLRSGKVTGQKLLGMTRASDDQPGYVLATPTVVRLTASDVPVIAIGTAKGELHVLSGDTLEEKKGFPLLLDSVAAQVAVGDIFDGGKLDLLVGDYSGNVYCVDGEGVRVWERELGKAIASTLRLMDVDQDGGLEVIVTSVEGDVWVLNAQTGKDWSPDVFPVHLNSRTESPALMLHVRNRARAARNQSSDTVAMAVGTSSGLYMVDVRDGCVQRVSGSSHVILETLAGDVDPYRPGLELVTVGLDGTLVCYAADVGSRSADLEAWSVEASGPLHFTHKSSSFFFTVNASREVSGKQFDMVVVLYANRFKSESKFNISVNIGTLTELYSAVLTASRRKTEFPLRLSSPNVPLPAFVTVHVCDVHQQCRSKFVHIRFNLHFEDHLRWFLSLPFLSLCAVVLWVHRRDGTSLSLPTSSQSKLTSGTRKNL